MSENRISVCMIVKNEQACLRRCLESVHSFADEVIVADTGSTDGSQEICRLMGARVYEIPWNDDFSEARNLSIGYAGGDWILWLDADEELQVADVTVFKEAIVKAEEDILPLAMLHYYGAPPVSPNRAYHSLSHRIFRNGKNLIFSGRIHEHLTLENTCCKIREAALPEAMLLHYGYLDTIVALKEKNSRNLRLLQQEQLSTDDPWIAYHIASEYYRAKQYQQAYQEVNHAIRRFLEVGALPPALAYKLKYELVLCSDYNTDSIIAIDRALQLYPDYVDLHYYKALLLMGTEAYPSALRELEHCLELGDDHTGELTLRGTGSFFALFYSGICHERLNQWDKAAQDYTAALSRWPQFTEAKQRLANISKSL